MIELHGNGRGAFYVRKNGLQLRWRDRQQSATLSAASWLSGSAVFVELTPVDLGDGSESVTVEDLNSISASPRASLRLRVFK